ncbi:MAG: outer membrane beta-barrel protein [Polyangia bacterium]
MNRALRMTRRPTADHGARRAARAAAAAVLLCGLPVRAQTATTPPSVSAPASADSPPGPVAAPAAGGEPSAHPDPSSKGQPSGGFVLSSPRASVILGGYAELFYQWNFNQPANAVTNFRGFDTRHNSVTISNVVLDTAGSVGPVSVRIALQYGHTPETYYLSEPASPATAGAGATGTQVWKFLQQALIGYRAPLGRGLLFEGGIYLSPIGIEGMAIKDQWNFSRSNLFFGLPFYHTGFRISYPLTGRLTATLHAVNGWNSVVDNNTPWSLAGELAYVVPERLTLHFVYFTGIERSTFAPEGQPWRHLFDAYATFQPRSWIALSLHGDAGFEPNAFGTSYWAAGAAYLCFMPHRVLHFGVRADAFHEHVAESAGGRAAPIFWPADLVASQTLTADVRPHGNLSLRLEYRHDYATAPMYFSSDPPRDLDGKYLPDATTQDTLTLGVVAWF